MKIVLQIQFHPTPLGQRRIILLAVFFFIPDLLCMMKTDKLSLNLESVELYLSPTCSQDPCFIMTDWRRKYKLTRAMTACVGYKQRRFVDVALWRVYWSGCESVLLSESLCLLHLPPSPPTCFYHNPIYDQNSVLLLYDIGSLHFLSQQQHRNAIAQAGTDLPACFIYIFMYVFKSPEVKMKSNECMRVFSRLFMISIHCFWTFAAGSKPVPLGRCVAQSVKRVGKTPACF